MQWDSRMEPSPSGAQLAPRAKLHKGQSGRRHTRGGQRGVTPPSQLPNFLCHPKCLMAARRVRLASPRWVRRERGRPRERAERWWSGSGGHARPGTLLLGVAYDVRRRPTASDHPLLSDEWQADTDETCSFGILRRLRRGEASPGAVGRLRVGSLATPAGGIDSRAECGYAALWSHGAVATARTIVIKLHNMRRIYTTTSGSTSRSTTRRFVIGAQKQQIQCGGRECHTSSHAMGAV